MFASNFLALLLATVAVLCGCEQLDVPVLFLFEKSKGLRIESPVVYRDTAVGRVTAVEPGEGGHVHVRAHVGWAMFKYMNRPCTALIERNKHGYYETAKCVVIYLAEGAEPVTRPINKIEGCDSRTGLLLWQGSHMAKAFMSDHQEDLDAVKQAARDAAQWVEELADSEETREFIEKLNKLAEESGEKARGLYEDLRKQWPKVAEQLEKVSQRLEELGRSKEAQRLRESIRNLFSDSVSPTPTPKQKETGEEI